MSRPIAVLLVIGLAMGGCSVSPPITSPPNSAGLRVALPTWLPGPSKPPVVRVHPGTPGIASGFIDVTIAARAQPAWSLNIQETRAGGTHRLLALGPGATTGVVAVCGQRVPYLALSSPFLLTDVSVTGPDQESFAVQGVRLDLRQVLRIAFGLRVRGVRPNTCKLPRQLRPTIRTGPSRSHTSSVLPEGGSEFQWATTSPVHSPPGARVGTPQPLGTPGEYVVTNYLATSSLKLWAGYLANTPREGFLAVERNQSGTPRIILVPISNGYVVLTRLVYERGVAVQAQFTTAAGVTGTLNLLTLRASLTGG